MITLTLKNYRCFADTKPLVIDLQPGLTALVGPNNSGKSSFLRFLFEFQPLWQNLSNSSFLYNSIGAFQGIGTPRSVTDINDVTCDYTKRPMQIRFDSHGAASDGQPHLRSLTLDQRVVSLLSYKSTLEFDPPETRLQNGGGSHLVSQKGALVSWEEFTSLFNRLNNCMFAPAFRNAINEGASTIYDFALGTGLISLWDQWKAGATRNSKLAMQQVTEDIRRIFRLDSLEINSTSDNKTLDVFVNRKPYRLNDLGSGLSQFIILFANVAVRKPSMLLIDEPELNLHPSLQADFLTSLASYTTTNSVIFATHSIGLARSIADKIYSFQLTQEGAIVRPFEETLNYAEFLGELSFSSVRELGFRRILMVEGPSEVKTIQQFLRLLGKDHEIVILHLGGSAMIASDRKHELAELKRITTDVAVLIDSERNTENDELARDRAKFLEDCKSLGFVAKATDRRALENYLSERAVKEIKGSEFRGLKPFEGRESLERQWAKRENWRIARAMSMEELLSNDLGQFLKIL